MRRRTLLACLPATGTLLPVAAGAFRLEAPSAATAADYGSGCPAADSHAALPSEMERLVEDSPLSPIPVARCRFCGCAVAGSPDHGEDRAQPAE